MKRFFLPLCLMLISTHAYAGEATTVIHCLAGTLKADVEMVEIGDIYFDIQAKTAKTSYKNESSNVNNKAPATSTAVLDPVNGVLAVVGLQISDGFTSQDSTLISVPKTYVHKPNTDNGPGDATFTANLNGPMTDNKNVLLKCTLHVEI